jgi:hypothetical protein
MKMQLSYLPSPVKFVYFFCNNCILASQKESSKLSYPMLLSWEWIFLILPLITCFEQLIPLSLFIDSVVMFIFVFLLDGELQPDL